MAAARSVALRRRASKGATLENEENLRYVGTELCINGRLSREQEEQ
jgi:hypothetical protein